MAVLKSLSGIELEDDPFVFVRLPLPFSLNTILLPFFQSEITVLPNMYCLRALGSTRASHTAEAGASMTVEALATSLLGMVTSLSESGL